MAAAESRREDETPSATPLPDASVVKKTGAAERMICSCPKQPENEDFAAPEGFDPALTPAPLPAAPPPGGRWPPKRMEGRGMKDRDMMPKVGGLTLIPGSGFRLLVSELHMFLVTWYSIAKCLSQAQNEKDFLRLQKKYGNYEKTLNRLRRKLGLSADSNFCQDELEAAVIKRFRAELIPGEQISHE